MLGGAKAELKSRRRDIEGRLAQRLAGSLEPQPEVVGSWSDAHLKVELGAKVRRTSRRGRRGEVGERQASVEVPAHVGERLLYGQRVRKDVGADI